MSVDAITYAKALDVDNPMSRLLLFIIAENTFNDTGLCKVSQIVLCQDTRASERTVREHLHKLRDAKAINIIARPKSEGGRLCDAIELVGFVQWLGSVRGNPEPAKSAGSGGGAEPAENAGLPVPEPANRLPVRYKDKSPVHKSPVQTPPTPSQARGSDDDFEEFWNTYPRKTSKGKARDAWRSAVEAGADSELMVEGAQRYAASKPDPQYTKHPATWLNQECWHDEYAGRRSGSVRLKQALADDTGPAPRDSSEPFARQLARSIVDGHYAGPIAPKWKADVERYLIELREAPSP